MATAFNPIYVPIITMEVSKSCPNLEHCSLVIHDSFIDHTRLDSNNEGKKNSIQVNPHTATDYLKKSNSYTYYKTQIVNFMEEANKTYRLPTDIHNIEFILYSSQTVQAVIEMLKDEKSIKKCSSVDITKEYFTNTFDIV